ncbi:MAG TPA: hypothetical protein VLG12_08070 [Candidatus Saccharimonadales bacterium]|nr:hypothetical protein [Candidatus Saccharimonadales bacterium]
MEKEQPQRISPDNYIPMSENEQTVAEVRAVVESALRGISDPFAQFESRLNDKESMCEDVEYYMPRLSTNASELIAEEGEENNELLSMCSDLTDMVASALRVAQVPYKINTTGSHTSLILNNIHVDPSIGQLVQGYNTIFVGTKDELTQLIKDSYQQGNLVNLAFYSSEDVGTLSPHPTPEEILNKFWGI